jgi:hypothetical protein
VTGIQATGSTLWTQLIQKCHKRWPSCTLLAAEKIVHISHRLLHTIERCSLSWDTWTQSTLFNPITLRYI